ncbi:hypothetical protein WPS_29280 [Vulcanimicrobium alpinum]|uniref:Polymer-forming cytoskeletal protein n=1 Tax=Vulcanimicrobium alpinum TaxID=3016050 RepID=A0AAN1XYC1_UNVUL|nr:hypothetical protein [Vulcanimicrobium alpinum]BDE07652.1 hypothetical protein WPS_29280 [Vulcanimicrobium alpinum]
MIRLRLVALFAFFFALAGAFGATPADARGHDGDVTRLFTDYTVEQGETVDGNLNVVFGDATVYGRVRGDCVALFGSCTLAEGGEVDGHNYSVTNDVVRAFVPAGISVIAEQDRRLVGNLASSAVVVLVFLLFPLRMRVALARVERHPALAALAGAVAAVLILPVTILLAISIIGIPLIVLEVAAIFAGLWIGQGAIALVVGRRLAELVMPTTTPSPLVALILGLVVVSAAEIVPIVGWVVTALVWLVGLGAAILTFVRSTELDGAVRRAPIGGPPMQGWR